MINTTDMANLYISLTNSVTAKLDELYTADKIDAETYAKIIAQSFENAMQLSVTAVQNQEKLDKEKDKITKEILVLGEEALNKAKEGALLDAQKDDVIKDAALKAAQITKIDAEKALLAQKLITEQDAVSTAASQRSVLAAQAAGYAKDADQKAADILMKGFAILANANDFTEITGSQYGITTTKLKSALDKLNSA